MGMNKVEMMNDKTCQDTYRKTDIKHQKQMPHGYFHFLD